MYRTAMRTATRPALRTTTATSTMTTTTAATTRSLLRPTPASRRLASTTPANRPRTWKGSLARWGLVAGAVYYYNTSPVFADEVVSAAAGSSSSSRGTIDAPPQFDDSELPTVDSVLENKRRQIQARLEKKHEASPAEKADGPAASGAVDAGAQEGGGAAALEEEAGQQGAFNPETGEINWDCPCLGGMAHGPCGEEFRTAFSCFVYSNEEPKGMDCIEKFQSMQGCFRQYPDIYGAELNAEDEAEAEAELDAQPAAAQNVGADAPQKQNGEGGHQKIREDHPPPSSAAQASRDSTKSHDDEEKEPALPDASPDAAPTKWSDATAANEDVKRQNKPKDAMREA